MRADSSLAPAPARADDAGEADGRTEGESEVEGASGTARPRPEDGADKLAWGAAPEADVEETAGAGAAPDDGESADAREDSEGAEPPPGTSAGKIAFADVPSNADADISGDIIGTRETAVSDPFAESTLANAPSGTSRATPTESPEQTASRSEETAFAGKTGSASPVMDGWGLAGEADPDALAAGGIADRPILPEANPDVLAKDDEAEIEDEAAAATEVEGAVLEATTAEAALSAATAPPAAEGDAPLIEPGFGIAARGAFGSVAAKRCRHPKHTSASSKARAWQTGQVFIALPLSRAPRPYDPPARTKASSTTRSARPPPPRPCGEAV